MNATMKRFNCTVGDKRGEFGDCMERHGEGRYVTHDSAKNLISSLENHKGYYLKLVRGHGYDSITEMLVADTDNKKLISELTNRLAKVELAYAILEGRNKELTDNIS